MAEPSEISAIDHRAVAQALLRDMPAADVNPDAVQERLESMGIDYDHTDVERIEWLVENWSDLPA